MRLSTTIISEDYQGDPQDYVNRLAEHWRSWPAPLADALQRYTEGNTSGYRRSLRAALEPFIRQGRLPAVGRHVEVDVKRGRLRQAEGSKGTFKMSLASKQEDMEAVVSDAEREPITRFAYLANTGMGARQDTYRLEECEGIEGLMQTKYIQAYLGRYRHEPRLAENVRMAFTKMAANPYDTTSTRRWQRSQYHLDDSPRTTPHLRRFSLQDFPEIDGGSIAAETRIAYSVIKQDGEPMIALYGIFLKQDIESIQGPPRRR